MRLKLSVFLTGLLAVIFSLSPKTLSAQTANAGIVLGTVTDPTGAVVPGVKVDLTNTATNETRSTTANAAGQFSFPGVVPGNYKMTVSQTGFATSVISNLTVDVNKSYNLTVKLQIRSTTQTVEVTAGAQVELETADAVIGNVVSGEALDHLPTLNRDATELVTLQPGSTPYDATGFGNNGGTVAGARSDQNTVSIDGIDVTDNVIAGGANEAPIVPAGVDDMSEFRVGVANNNATFGRSAGGQVTFIDRSGTNQFHGTAYWFHQNSALNANTWENNRNGVPKPEQRDNRGGLSFGGPIFKNKTFFFGNYEIRRFFQSETFTRLIPSPSLMQGILQFKDASGNTVSYPLATSTLCGTGTTACDPRGLGISPTVKALWSLITEKANDNAAPGADGLNILGLFGVIPAPQKTDAVTFRLDHAFTNNIKFLGRYAYSRNLSPNDGQIDLRNGNPTNPSDSNIRGDSIIGGLDWQIRPTLTNSFRGGWVRSRQDFTVIRPSTSAAQLALAGTASSASQTGFIALAPGLATGGGFLDTLVDVDTQRARHQAIYDSNKQYTDTLTWNKGAHIVALGGDVRWLPTIHDRDDKVIGSLNSLVAALDGDHNFSIPGANRPPTCAGLVTTNCLQVGDTNRWDRLYAASLGLVDNVGILTASDGNLNPLPFGSTLVAHATLRSYYYFGQDTWRVTPSLTMTYGLAYGWQTTPQERDGKQTFMVDATNASCITTPSSCPILTAQGYLNQKAAAAAQGNFFDPTIGYLPIKSSGRSNIFNVDYGDVAPRFSLAWNPSFSNGMIGKVFGDRKTVVRGGYGIAYDRVNTVGSVIIPMLGVGFAQTLSTIAPGCTASGTGGAGCGVNTTPGGSIFRVGVDGAIPAPAPLGKQTIPVVPGAPFSEVLSFANDPNFRVGRNHMVDFTIQRETPGNMLLEIGFIGRYARHLLNNVNFDSSPIMFRDNSSGQTFAQAYDLLSAQVRNGQAITPQPWFEHLVPLAGCNALFGTAAATSTACLGQGDLGDFVNFNVSDLFLNMDIIRGLFSGLPTFNNLNILDMFVRTPNDFSNYNAGFIALHNRGWRGLQFDLNYTFSRSLDQIGTVQNSASYFASSFNPHYEYGPSFFDRTHVFNAIYNYNLPFGSGHQLSSSHGFINRLIGGWYTGGIFRANSGAPLTVVEGQTGSSLGGGLIFGISQSEIPIVDPGSIQGGLPPSGANDNFFKNPAAVLNDFRAINLASDGRTGRANPLRGFGLWNLDASFGKRTTIYEKYSFEFRADFFNLFNHANFLDPTLDVTNLPTFGVVSQTLTPANRLASSRWIQFGLRVSF